MSDGFDEMVAVRKIGIWHYLLIATCLITFAFLVTQGILRELAKDEKSVLTLHAFLTGAYGPDKKTTDVDIDIGNAPEEPINNLDLTIAIPSHRIQRATQQSAYAGECQLTPVPLPDSRVVIEGLNKRDHPTLDSQDVLNGQSGIDYFFQWRLRCSRIDGLSTVRIQLMVSGNAENDTAHISGSYERIPSKGNVLVKIDEKVSIMRN